MKDSNSNPAVEKSKKFAIRIIRLRKYLVSRHREFTMSDQLLRCGTSIGANVKEAIRGQSKADFGAKMNIALKEASETEYWLEILHEAGSITKFQFDSIINDCRELIRLLTAIVKSTFRK